MCLRYCVLGFAAHSNISGVDCLLMMTAFWMMTTTNSWVTVQISRSVQTSSTISCETPIYIILYVLRDVRTLFMYYFWEIRYILLYCFDKTLLRSFWAPACVWSYILKKLMLPISMLMSYLLVEIVFWKWYQMFLISAAIKWLRKLNIEFSIVKNE